MKFKRVLYCVPLLLLLGCLIVTARFKAAREKARRVQATRELVRLCETGGDENYLQYASRLLNAGANPNALNSKGEPLLLDTNAALAEKLVTAGANVNIHNKEGLTPLMEASGQPGEDAAQCVHVLLRAGANPNLVDTKENTALLMASQLLTADSCGEACFLNPDVARYLLAKGAWVDVRDLLGNTPLSYIASAAHDDGSSKEFVHILLAYGADPQLRNKKGQSPLLLARQQLRGVALYDQNALKVIAMMQAVIKQRKTVKSPRT